MPRCVQGTNLAPYFPCIFPFLFPGMNCSLGCVTGPIHHQPFAIKVPVAKQKSIGEDEAVEIRFCFRFLKSFVVNWSLKRNTQKAYIDYA